ncbi:TetR/AcrR family transcriptional regulator [Paenibacillus athensensis]|uniref:TetR family transcriptional regulator n=1 Tax=Paenibacillus athensensis TaxID=1967502 RepID=A0A4Y8Q982_9BACL|nr:TetR/AcrR family transcriptional regulator [Paenibacillus athensensis]MCD1260349.1 TetR/AcrR family transcriptional regulator [Paenibacillus athensensis]
MVRPKEFDEREALAAAMQVFWEKGYEATSISDLTARMAIQRPSLYATFGGKKELFAAALKAYAQSVLAYLENKLLRGPSAKAAIRAYFDEVIDDSAGSNPDYGCLCVNTMVELGPHEPEFARVTEDFRIKLTELFEQALHKGLADGELPQHVHPAAMARLLTMAAIGLSVTMKTKPARTQVQQIPADMMRLLD